MTEPRICSRCIYDQRVPGTAKPAKLVAGLIKGRQ